MITKTHIQLCAMKMATREVMYFGRPVKTIIVLSPVNILAQKALVVYMQMLCLKINLNQRLYQLPDFEKVCTLIKIKKTAFSLCHNLDLHAYTSRLSQHFKKLISNVHNIFRLPWWRLRNVDHIHLNKVLAKVDSRTSDENSQ